MNKRKETGLRIWMLAYTGAVLPFFFGCITTFQRPQTAFYISPNGDDSAAGSLEQPWRTLQHARDFIRTINQNMHHDIVVYLRGGIYPLDRTFELTSLDSGMNGYRIIYKAYQNEKPILNGAVPVRDWEHHVGNIWKARLVRDRKLRALYINGKRAMMAGMSRGVIGQGGYGTFTITGKEEWASTSGTEFAGIKFKSDQVGVYRNPQNVELCQSNIWSEPILCVKDMFYEDGYTIAMLQQPYGAIALNMSWVPFHADPRPDRPIYIRNAFELLDEPGEFYFDDQADTVYYYSRGEDMTTAQVYAPAVEGLVSIKGENTSLRVRNIQFYGLTFAYDDYLLSLLGDSRGWVSVQSLSQFVRYIENGNWHPNRYNDITIPKGTVTLCNADSIRLERNRFEHLASAVALNLENDVINTAVVGNYFGDLMGTSVNIGHPQHYQIGDGQQFPRGIEGVCKNILIANNYVHNACLDFRQLEGMTGFFVENVKIVHNEICGTPYGGIALGWWWGNAQIPPSTVAKNNSIMYNRIGSTHRVLQDGGIIYVLGEQPDSEIAYNYCYDGPRCIYPDDGSAYWKIHHNVILNELSSSSENTVLWLHIWTKACHDMRIDNNYVRADNIRCEGTNCPITRTIVEPNAPPWSKQAEAIIKKAGLEPAYQDIKPGFKHD
ncbi:MAG TPA: hypothetical protein PK052_03490 [Anaerohalosphaeraceae bacterium]|nr:right-handed parallel beta-helix repeat-containing protein [Phycisphaerae bacterium]HOK95154.1 hypothetical protein [Anaerohalosphaeraceae bacterium]HOL31024.1 hypothetical protein [Anaerohalosphaeraceae bacterium]HOM75723.1 hypothetical protein [Anaerohalosphaeraceae bacterium]HPC63540.1 hypothetical protein [Anaerohalosphaeraceae bacterium]